MKKKGITVAGSLLVDNYYIIDTYPKQGRLVKIRGRKMDIGGSGNLIIDLAKLNSETTIKVSSIIGKDEYGEFIIETLKQYKNINISNLCQKLRSCHTIVMDALDNHERTFFFMPEVCDLYDIQYIDWELLDADIFHLEYLLLMKQIDAYDSEFGTHAARILYEAQKRGMKTSIDVVSDISERGKNIIRASLKYTDYCTINEIEAEMVTGLSLLNNGLLNEDKVIDSLKLLNQMGVSQWAVIHSPSISYGLDCKSGNIVTVQSLQLPIGYIKGTTGAGDAFCSGLLYAAYLDKDIEYAMRLGNACAACSLSEISGTAGMKSYSEICLKYKHYL